MLNWTHVGHAIEQALFEVHDAQGKPAVTDIEDALIDHGADVIVAHMPLGAASVAAPLLHTAAKRLEEKLASRQA